MAKETKQSSDICLPADFFYADFLVEGHHNLQELEDEKPVVDCEDDCMSVLARKMTNNSIDDNIDKPFPNFMPENSKASNGGIEHSIFEPSLMSSLPQNPSNDNKCSFFSNAGNHFLMHQELQAAHFHKLRQQQLVSQQMTAVYGQHRKAKPVSAAGRDQDVKLQDSEMRAVFLRSEKKKESKGTGVFLPRTAVANEPTKKKQGCSTVLVPTRVMQALNLKLDEFGELPRVPDGYVFDHDALIGRSNGIQRTNSNHRQYYDNAPSAVVGREIKHSKERAF